MGGTSFIASASTLLPRRVNHLNVSSYFSGTEANIPLIVSGAPLTAIRLLLPAPIEEIVAIRLSAELNWNRRRIKTVLVGEGAETGVVVRTWQGRLTGLELLAFVGYNAISAFQVPVQGL